MAQPGRAGDATRQLLAHPNQAHSAIPLPSRSLYYNTNVHGTPLVLFGMTLHFRNPFITHQLLFHMADGHPLSYYDEFGAHWPPVCVFYPRSLCALTLEANRDDCPGSLPSGLCKLSIKDDSHISLNCISGFEF